MCDLNEFTIQLLPHLIRGVLWLGMRLGADERVISQTQIDSGYWQFRARWGQATYGKYFNNPAVKGASVSAKSDTQPHAFVNSNLTVMGIAAHRGLVERLPRRCTSHRLKHFDIDIGRDLSLSPDVDGAGAKRDASMIRWSYSSICGVVANLMIQLHVQLVIITRKVFFLPSLPSNAKARNTMWRLGTPTWNPQTEYGPYGLITLRGSTSSISGGEVLGLHSEDNINFDSLGGKWHLTICGNYTRLLHQCPRYIAAVHRGGVVGLGLLLSAQALGNGRDSIRATNSGRRLRLKMGIALVNVNLEGCLGNRDLLSLKPEVPSRSGENFRHEVEQRRAQPAGERGEAESHRWGSVVLVFSKWGPEVRNEWRGSPE
ncbi:hypothetical protein BC826DRAFT_1174493 [Russula brevipes]|nr:hypothetical protein BC826DRAFT_1174493 [Russula brevipes]